MPTSSPPAVVNATGRILDPALGGTPWAAAARSAAAAAAGYADLGLDPLGTTGAQAAALLGAGDALVVSSLPGALALVLAGLPWRTVVARPDLVQIGGARLPDLARATGVDLVEIGAADVVTDDDYRAALSPAAGVMVVHPARGADRPSWPDVVTLADEAEAPHVHVVLSGSLHDHPVLATADAGRSSVTAPADEPSAAEVLDAGADLVVVPTDNLGGGPALALVAGSPAVLAALRRHPLATILRPDRTLVAALGATLDAHDTASPPLSLPVHAMLATDAATLQARARSLAAAVGRGAEPVPCRSSARVAPRQEIVLDGWGLLVPSGDPDALARRLADGDPTVVGLPDEAGVILDLRTVAPSHDPLLARCVQAAVSAGASQPTLDPGPG